MAHGLIFKGSVLAYDPTRDEAEWVPTHGVANDLSWAEERMADMLANFVPHTPRGRSHHRAWDPPPPGLDQLLLLKGEGEQMQQEGDEPEEDECEEVEGWGESNPKALLVMRYADGVRPKWRCSHEDDCGSGCP